VSVYLTQVVLLIIKAVYAENCLSTNGAKVEDTAGPRHKGRSCSRLPQGLDNAGDAVSSAFLKGKQHSKKGVFIGCYQRLDLMMVTPINAKPLSKPFNEQSDVLFMQR
jgi:hypothetical protein